MYESKPMKKFESKIEKLQVGEMVGHELVWENPNNPNYKEIVANNIVDGIGKGMRVISPNGVEYVGLLIDFDYDSNGKLTRFIFVYYNKDSKREYVIDTNQQIGWTIVYDGQYYKL